MTEPHKPGPTRKRVLVVFAVGLVLLCAAGWPSPASGSGQQDVLVVRSGEKETEYSIAVGDCRIRWTVYSSEANAGVIRHRSDCGLSLGQQAPLIAKVLRKVLSTESQASRFRTLTWGRLLPDGSKDTTMAERLVFAAERSPGWDVTRGRPKKGDVNGFVRTLANDAVIYEELRPVFAEAGLELRLASVEKVLVLPAKQLRFFERLHDAGIHPRDRVPFDFQAWFSIRPINISKP
jgi:hypothetical protein